MGHHIGVTEEEATDGSAVQASDRVLQWAPYVLLAVTVAWVAERGSHALKDPDSWWHLRLGADFLHQHSFADPHWSSFATSAWVPTQPLPEVVSALIDKWLGLPGVVWLYVAALVVLVLGTYLLDRVWAGPLPAAVATLLFVATAEGAMTPRPQLISYGLLAVVVTTWLRTEQDLRPRWWLLPLCWFWSLCHGFWFIGVAYGVLAVVAIALARRVTGGQLLRLAALALGSGLVVLLNPLGPRVLAAPIVVSERGQYLTEWQRTSLTSGPALAAFAMVIAVTAIWIWRPDEVTWFRVLLVLSSLVWTWYAVRTVALAGVVLSPLVAAALQRLIAAPDPSISSITVGPRSTQGERRSLLAASAALLAVVAFVVPHTAAQPGRVPLGLNSRLDRLPPGTTVLNDFVLGGWLAWRHPDLDRWVDGLADAYPVSHLRETATITFVQPGWRRVLARSGAQIALIQAGSPLERALQGLGWTTDGIDRGWVLLVSPGQPSTWPAT